MNDHELRLSKLRCEPHRIDPAQLPSYYGPPYTFWRVFVDDQLLTATGQPFTAYDPVIELLGCLDVPIWGDGGGYVSVRQIGPFVIWCNPIEESLDDFIIGEGLPPGKYLIFDLVDYTETLRHLAIPAGFIWNNAERSRSCSRNLSYPESADPASSLPRFSSSELRSVLWPDLPSDDLPLYRIPEHTDDPRGVKLLRRIKSGLLVDDLSLTAVTPPSTWLDITIGLDLPKDAECFWRVGKTSEGWAVLFLAKPRFPLWLSSTSLNAVLSDEC